MEYIRLFPAKVYWKHFSLYPSPPPSTKSLQHWARNPLYGEVLNRGNGVRRDRCSMDRRRIHSVEGWGHSPPHLTNWRLCNKFLGSKWSYGCYLTMESQAKLGWNRLKIACFRIGNSETQINKHWLNTADTLGSLSIVK